MFEDIKYSQAFIAFYVQEVLIRVERVVNDYTPPVLLSLFMVILVSLVFFLVWGFVWSHQLRNNRKRIQDRMSRDPVFQKSSRWELSLISV